MSLPIAASAPQWITACAAVAGLVVALGTILHARRVSRRNAAYQYVAFLETADFRALEQEAGAFFKCVEAPPGTPMEDWKKLDRPERERRQWAWWKKLVDSWEEDDRTKARTILALPNQLEDIAGAYNLGLIDRRVVKTHIEYLIEEFWREAAWWLTEMRRDPTVNAYQDLAMMYPHLRKQKRPRWHRPREGRIKPTFD